MIEQKTGMPHDHQPFILDVPGEVEQELDFPEPPPRQYPEPPAEAVIRDMVAIIVARFQPARILLFGSRARGTWRPRSDVDLLVVFPSLEEPRATAIAITDSLYASALPKDIIVATPEEIASEQQFPGSVLETAVRDGIVLYDRSGLCIRTSRSHPRSR